MTVSYYDSILWQHLSAKKQALAPKLKLPIVMNVSRMYFYRRGSYQVQLELELESGQVTVERQFGFSLCAAPPRSFLCLNYEGSSKGWSKEEYEEGSAG